ncbi:hypothetical protein VRB95_10200 [Erwinia aphidicola]
MSKREHHINQSATSYSAAGAGKTLTARQFAVMRHYKGDIDI